jgi:hypothetical protein
MPRISYVIDTENFGYIEVSRAGYHAWMTAEGTWAGNHNTFPFEDYSLIVERDMLQDRVIESENKNVIMNNLVYHGKMPFDDLYGKLVRQVPALKPDALEKELDSLSEKGLIDISNDDKNPKSKLLKGNARFVVSSNRPWGEYGDEYNDGEW